MPQRWGFLSVIVLVTLGFIAFIASASATPILAAPTPAPTPLGRIATSEELAIAQSEWAMSSHADTYDKGLGANTTCARCKSPMNWDPSHELAAQEALDCGACKRIPGAQRPKLETGNPVPKSEWINIPCAVCHIPAGDSYYVDIAFWNQTSGQYESVDSPLELCAKCHEGRHGFEVVEEQRASKVHQGWECTLCHGPHGSPSACVDCHDPTTGSMASELARHPSVNCTACHDAGGLSIWYETDPASPHYGEYITRRFAHTLTSWPSHNLQREVECRRCHHPKDVYSPATAPDVSCKACHPEGASLFWCVYFNRNSDPNSDVLNEPQIEH